MAIKRILITGARGFIGKYLLNRLIEDGYEVRGISSEACFEFIHCPLENKENILRVILYFQPNIVIHLAAVTSVTHLDSIEIYRTNVIGTENLLNAIVDSGLKDISVVLASSAGVYGNQSHSFLSEELPFKPTNHYSYSKMIMEIISRQFTKYFPIKIVRLFNIIGVGQSQSFFIPKIIEHFANRTRIIKLGNLDVIRDYMDVKTCVDIFCKIIEPDCILNGPLNICTAKGFSALEIFAMMAEIADFAPKIEIDPRFVRKNEVWRAVGSKEKLETVIKEKVDPLPLKKVLFELYNKELNN